MFFFEFFYEISSVQIVENYSYKPLSRPKKYINRILVPKIASSTAWKWGVISVKHSKIVKPSCQMSDAGLKKLSAWSIDP